MKKSILLLAAVAALAPAANAKSAMDGILSCKWMNTNVAALHTDARQAVAIDGKFYLQNHTTGKLEVWDATGKVSEVASGATTNVTMDEAGHIIARLTPAFPNAAATQTIRVFDANDLTNTSDFSLTNMPNGRADFYGHVSGNVLSDEGGTLACGGNWVGNMGVAQVCGGDAAAVQYPFSTLAHNSVKVSGTFTTTHQIGAYSFLPGELTLLSPHYQTTNTTSGNGNSIYRLAKDATGAYVPAGFYVTPNHNGCSGYEFFECDGNKYVVYSTGSNLADGFTVAKAVVKDTPANEVTDAEARVATKYAEATEDNASTLYKNNAFYGNHFSVEPAGDHKVYIYQYCPNAYIAQYELDLTQFAPTAINDINTEKVSKARKYVVDGQIVIEKDGVKYNVAGQAIK